MKNDDISGYTRLILCWLLAMASGITWAQNQTTDTLKQQHEDTDENIVLSPSFMNALKGAFEMTPMADTIRYQENLLTRDQLREWVGEPDPTLYNTEQAQQMTESAVDPKDPYTWRLDSTYKALKLWEVDPRCLGITPPTTSFMMPNIAAEIVVWKSKNGKYMMIRTKDGGTAMSGFDFNALARYIRPSQIRLRKSQALANKNRAKMDAAYPILRLDK